MKYFLSFSISLLSLISSDDLLAQPAFSAQLAAGKNGGFSDVVATSDGGYIYAGYTANEAFRLNDMWLVKASPRGNVQWSKRYGDSLSETAACITETSDGNYVAAGMEFVHKGIHTYEKIVLIKLNAKGEKVWTKYIDAAFHNFVNAICPLPDGSVMIGGWINKNQELDLTNSSTFLAVVDKNGNVVKSVTYGEPGYRRWVVGLFPVSNGVIVVSQNNDGGVFISEKTAYAYSLLELNKDTSKGYVFRIDGTGTHFTQSACAGKNGTLTISGTWGDGPSNFNVCTVQFNKNGVVNWINLTGGENDYRPYDAVSLPDGDILITGGYTGPSGGGDFNSWPMMIRINKDGLLKKSYQWDRPTRSIYAAAFNKNINAALLAESDNFTFTPQYPVLNNSDQNFDFCLPEVPLGGALPVPAFILKRKDFILRNVNTQVYNRDIMLENYKAEVSEVCSPALSF